MTHYPRRLLITAIICTALQFLLGTPSLSEGTGTVQDVSMVLQLIDTVIGLAALVLAVVGFRARRRSAR
jgi:hypothetical protein